MLQLTSNPKSIIMIFMKTLINSKLILDASISSGVEPSARIASTRKDSALGCLPIPVRATRACVNSEAEKIKKATKKLRTLLCLTFSDIYLLQCSIFDNIPLT